METRTEYLTALRRGDTSAVLALLAHDRTLVRLADAHGKTALHWAAERDDLDLARAAIDAGADIEALTAWGAAPLDWAATMGSIRVADLLTALGATGQTVIVAAGLGQLERVRRAIDTAEDLSSHRRRGAPLIATDEWPADSAHVQGDIISDALYAAARNGHTEVVTLLLDRGASPDAKGFFGGTALHWAAFNGHEETVQLLLTRGARVDLRDNRFNATPEEWAREGGHPEIADRIRQHR